ncbi:MAG: hypothetical protein DRN20_02660 [Thermoplasmata archaeon]|nr:MAG: hypothetical protein DRN20_02660 [Thermoplasmata archaeon]
MKVAKIRGLGYESNVYVIYNYSEDRECTIVDTGLGSNHAIAETMKIINALRVESVKIILTHRHCDHVCGLPAILKKLNAKGCDTEIFAHHNDAKAIAYGDRTVLADSFGIKFGGVATVKAIDEGEIEMGEQKAKIVHTPGHTPGSICIYVNNTLFSGDTLFAGGGVGRWDLPMGDINMLMHSLQKIAKFDIRALHPGHGPSIYGHEARNNASEAYQYIKRILEMGIE